MKFLIIPKLNLIVGWNPKVACTTIKYLLLTKLGFKIEGNIHNDMLTKQNLESGKYDIYNFPNPKFSNIDLTTYIKLCVIRNPYKRLISGIRQRSNFFINEFIKFGWFDISENTITDFLQNLKTHNFIENHFYPQVTDINNFRFDYILSIEKIDKLYEILELPYVKNQKIGGHDTKYNDNDKINYYSLTIKDISLKDNQYIWSSNINSWFTKDNIQLINKLYKDDFEWLSKNGFDYKIN